MQRLSYGVACSGPFTVEGYQQTFSAQAPAGLAGTVASRWRVLDRDGRSVASGLGDRARAERHALERAADEVPVDVQLADGGIVAVAAGVMTWFVGLDGDGHRVLSQHGLLYPITDCCGASGKGSESETGVVCRSCYRTVDALFGDTATVVFPVAGR